jgi:hypothetical protein
LAGQGEKLLDFRDFFGLVVVWVSAGVRMLVVMRTALLLTRSISGSCSSAFAQMLPIPTTFVIINPTYSSILKHTQIFRETI